MLDIIVALTIAFGFYLGVKRGLIKTVFDTLSIILAIVISLKLSPLVIKYVDQVITVSPTVSYLVGLVLTFLVVIFLVRLIGSQIERLLNALQIGLINKLLGGALQALFFAFILSMGIWLLNQLKVLNPDIAENSVTYEYLEPLPEKGQELFVKLEPTFREFWETTMDRLDQVRENVEESQPH